MKDPRIILASIYFLIFGILICKLCYAYPIADAGNDIMIDFRTTSVTLNGSGSYDTNGCSISYSWTKYENGELVFSSKEVNPQVFVKIPSGSLQYTLKVTNKCGVSDEDVVTIWKNSSLQRTSRFKDKDCKDGKEYCDPNDPCYTPDLCDPNYVNCKDDLYCDPTDPCFDANSPYIWFCDPNVLCKEKLECDPTKKCYDPNHPDMWMCFYEEHGECNIDNLICDPEDPCFNTDYPDLYILCCDANCATAIDLFSFIVKWDGNSVLIEWLTAQEIDNVGFYIYRSVNREGQYEKISKLIPASATGAMGVYYSYYDLNVILNEKYYYKLEDVDYDGTITKHGPVCTTNDIPEEYGFCECDSEEYNISNNEPINYDESSDEVDLTYEYKLISEVFKDKAYIKDCFINSI